MILDYTLLGKALEGNRKKEGFTKLTVDASLFLERMSKNYNLVEDYFMNETLPQLEAADKMFSVVDFEESSTPISVYEILHKF